MLPSSVTDNLRGRILPSRAMMCYLSLQLSVSEDGLKTETGLTERQTSPWDWHIIRPSSPHDELPLHRREVNNFSVPSIIV